MSIGRVFQRGAIIISRTPKNRQNADRKIANPNAIQESESESSNPTL
jgi:hypothetical protein